MKISLSDLTGTEVQDTENPIASVIKEEIEQILSAKKNKISKIVPTFLQPNPANPLEKVLLNQKLKDAVGQKSLHEKILLARFDAKMARIKKIKSRKFKKQAKRAEIKKKFNKADDIPSDPDDSDSLEEEDLENVQETKTRLDSCSDFVKKLLSRKAVPKEIPQPIFEFRGDPENSHKAVISELFASNSSNEFESKFVDIKKDIIGQELPEEKEIVLHGWGSWTGTGLETIKTRFNTIYVQKDGVSVEKRKDLKQKHVIINHDRPPVMEKYQARLPHGMSENTYRQRLQTPVSRELNSAQSFMKYIKNDNAHPEDFYVHKSKQ